MWLTVSGAFAKVLMFAASVLTYKGLSVPENGLLGFALAYGTIAALMMEMGTRGYLIRELSRVRDDNTAASKLYTAVLNTRGLLILALGPLSLLLALVLGYRGGALAFLCALLGYALLDSIAIMQKGVLRCYDRMQYDAVFSAIGKGLLVLMLAAAFVTKHFRPGIVGGAYVISSLLEVCALWVVSAKQLPVRWTGGCSTGELRLIARYSWPFASIVMLIMLYLRTSVFALWVQPWLVYGAKLLHLNPPVLVDAPEVSVAQFTTAARLPETLSFLPVAVMNAMIPFLARNKGNSQAVQSVFTVVSKYLGFAGFLAAPWLAIQAAAFLLLLSKPEYLRASPAFAWLAFAIPFSFLHYTTANLLICLDLERAVLRRELVALIVNILLNVVLIPFYGFTGAAIALTACEAISLVLDLHVLRARGLRLPLVLWTKWLGAAVVVGGVSYLGHDQRPVLAILPGGIAAAVMGTLVLAFEDLGRLRDLLSGARGMKTGG
jgi:O-antigen/teichoic acid export membrane protein